jgi:hypothetical protein
MAPMRRTPEPFFTPHVVWVLRWPALCLADGGVIAAAGPYHRFPCGPTTSQPCILPRDASRHCSRINSEPKYSA